MGGIGLPLVELCANIVEFIFLGESGVITDFIGYEGHKICLSLRNAICQAVGK